MYTEVDEALEYLTLRFKTVPPAEDMERALILASDKINGLDIRDRGDEIEAFPLLDTDIVPRIVKVAEIMEAYCIWKSEQDLQYSQTAIKGSSEDSGISTSTGQVSSITIDGMTKTFSTSSSSSSSTTSGQGPTGAPTDVFISQQAKEIMMKFIRRTYDW